MSIDIDFSNRDYVPLPTGEYNYITVRLDSSWFSTENYIWTLPEARELAERILAVVIEREKIRDQGSGQGGD